MSRPPVRLTINDQVVEVPAGTNLIEAAKAIGVEIPHFCYHPELCVAGNCRMCVVEVALPRKGINGNTVLEWSPKLTIACNTAAVEGMAVRTHTPRVIEARRNVMELLLINHPLDCPICDQAGECRLQELAMDYGRANSRFGEAKVKKPKKTPLGPKIMLDNERCILCSRCIRFMRDVAGQDCLGFVGRGSHSCLTCYPGREPASNYDLNIVDVCPVGALTSTDFRFTQRVWFLKQTRSICPHCANGCNIVIASREGVVYRQVPRDNLAVNKRWMCDTGRLNYRFINDPRRLRQPLVQRAGKRAVEWPEALKELIHRLQDIQAGGAGRIAFVGSARATTEELYLFRQLARALEVTVMDIVPRRGEPDALLVKADRNPNTRGALLAGIAAEPPGSRIQAMARGIGDGTIRALVVLGEDVTQAGLGPDLLAKLEFLAVIDMLPHGTTELAHVVLPGASFAEKSGTFVNAGGRIQRINAAVSSPGMACPEWQTLAALLVLCGQPGFASVEEVFGRMAGELAPLAGLTLEAIGSEGVLLHGN